MSKLVNKRVSLSNVNAMISKRRERLNANLNANDANDVDAMIARAKSQGLISPAGGASGAVAPSGDPPAPVKGGKNRVKFLKEYNSEDSSTGSESGSGSSYSSTDNDVSLPEPPEPNKPVHPKPAPKPRPKRVRPSRAKPKDIPRPIIDGAKQNLAAINTSGSVPVEGLSGLNDVDYIRWIVQKAWYLHDSYMSWIVDDKDSIPKWETLDDKTRMAWVNAALGRMR